MFDGYGNPHQHYEPLIDILKESSTDEFVRRNRWLIFHLSIRALPSPFMVMKTALNGFFLTIFCPVLLPIPNGQLLKKGLIQRMTALNLFLKDIYSTGKILADKVVPADIIYSCKYFRREIRGIKIPKDIYISVVGTDLVRLNDGRFAVLEDNLRVPSRVSHMNANRQVMKRALNHEGRIAYRCFA